MTLKRTLLNVVVDARPEIGRRLVTVSNCDYEIHDCLIGSGSGWWLIFKSFLLPRKLAGFDAVITSEYFSSFGINLRLRLTRGRTRHVTVGLNQSRRLLRFNANWVNEAINWVFGRGDLYIMHSTKELSLFSSLHGLPEDRLVFSHWGFDRPSVGDDVFADWPKPYFSLIGRNNRDVELFCQACEGISQDGIIICSSRQVLPADMPSNVHVFRELDMQRSMSCLLHSSANLILVVDGERGAGHITAVAGMELGTPQIASDVAVLSDYLIDGYNCIKVPLGDFSSLRCAMKRIVADSDLRRRLVENGRELSSRWLTHGAAVQRVYGAIHLMLDGRRQPSVEESWTRFKAEISSRASAKIGRGDA